MIRLAAALIVMAFPAAAQTNCAPEHIVKGNLVAKYGERQMFAALSERGHMVEFWGNDESETWTALIVHPGGLACIADSGTGLPTIEPAGIGL